MQVDPGIDIEIVTPLGFRYGEGVCGPKPECRTLASIRKNLLDPDCDGPDPVYAIAMDVFERRHASALRERMLLFGVVAYATGRLGREPVRSQGHIHWRSPHSGWAAPEAFEIWSGAAIIYAQEHAHEDPGRCIAVRVTAGQRAVVPPGWVHAVISADAAQPLVFGAWCDREYGFVYDDVRARGGLAWFPIMDQAGRIAWERNSHYRPARLMERSARAYPELGLDTREPMYRLIERDPDSLLWISDPASRGALWREFEP